MDFLLESVIASRLFQFRQQIILKTFQESDQAVAGQLAFEKCRQRFHRRVSDGNFYFAAGNAAIVERVFGLPANSGNGSVTNNFRGKIFLEGTDLPLQSLLP